MALPSKDMCVVTYKWSCSPCPAGSQQCPGHSISFQSFENDWHVAKVEAEERSSTKSILNEDMFIHGKL